MMQLYTSICVLCFKKRVKSKYIKTKNAQSKLESFLLSFLCQREYSPERKKGQTAVWNERETGCVFAFIVLLRTEHLICLQIRYSTNGQTQLAMLHSSAFTQTQYLALSLSPSHTRG